MEDRLAKIEEHVEAMANERPGSEVGRHVEVYALIVEELRFLRETCPHTAG